MRLYGILGIVLILLVEINFYFKVEPFASYYFPFVWFGYILLIDALVLKFHQKSLLHDNPWKFVFLLLSSALFWWLFELLNVSVGNWVYKGGVPYVSQWERLVFKTLSFATVLPAVFETAELVRVRHVFAKLKLSRSHTVAPAVLYGMIVVGVIALLLPILFPKQFFPLVWVAFFFLLDPVNYMRGEHSIVQHLKDRRLAIPVTLLVAGLVCGFFWEFWNFWAVKKWFYHVPYVGFLKIFEMPLLGYLGYIPFAFELYAMYHFVLHYAVQWRVLRGD